jgi:hypothetical protein
VLAVPLGVMPARLHMMMLRMAGMAMGGVGMMRCLLVIAGLVMMPCCMLMMLGRLLVMLHALMFAHISLPV